MPKLPTLTVHVALALILSGCTHDASADCFGQLREPLTVGGYSGGLDCTQVDVQVHEVKGNRATAASAELRVFDLRYKTKPENGLVPHGGQRLLFFDKAMRYLGQYSISTPPALIFELKDRAVVANVPDAAGNTILLGDKSPPTHAFLNQEVVTLYK